MMRPSLLSGTPPAFGLPSHHRHVRRSVSHTLVSNRGYRYSLLSDIKRESRLKVMDRFENSILKTVEGQMGRCLRCLAARLEPDNASILVCGGGGVALEVTRKLKDMGSWVWMLQRSDSRRAEIEGMMAIVVKGDAMSTDDLDKAFDSIEDVDAVVSTIGGTPADPSADSQGNINLIEAAKRKGVQKFVLVTSIGTGDSKGAPPKQVYDVLRPVLLQKEKAEQRLKEIGGLTYTIVRPGGLKNEAGTGRGVLTEDNSVCGAIHREDVADLIVKALFSGKADGKVLAAVDNSQLFGEPNFQTFDL